MRCTHEPRHYKAAINRVTTWRNPVTSSCLEASRSTTSFSRREKVPAGRMRVRAPDQSSGKSNAHRTTALQKAAIKYVSACEARRLAVTSTQPNNCVHLAWRRGQKSVAKRVEGTAPHAVWIVNASQVADAAGEFGLTLQTPEVKHQCSTTSAAETVALHYKSAIASAPEAY